MRLVPPICRVKRQILVPAAPPSRQMMWKHVRPGVVVEEGATVTRALVAENVHIGKKVKVGSKNSEEIKLVAEDVKGGTK